MTDLPAVVRPLEFLIGTWRGEGAGAVPGGGAPDFGYAEELTFRCEGEPWLSYWTRATALDGDERVVHAEAGWWRPQPAGDDGSVEIEVVLTNAFGVAEVLLGALVPDRAGVHVDLASEVVTRTRTSVPVTADKRLYARRGDKLMYAVDLSVGEGLAPHLAAALDRG